MKKAMLVFTLFFLIATNCFAENISKTPIKFMDIEWGSDIKTVTDVLNSRGFSPRKGEDESLGELLLKGFSGKMGPDTVVIVPGFASGRLIKIIIGILSNEKTYRDTYSEKSNALIEKYGKPEESFEFLTDPFDDSDLETHYEIVALKNGKGYISKFFKDASGDIVSIEINDELNVVISYESHKFSSFVDKVKKQRNSVF